MRIPLNWLGEFVKLPQNTHNLTDKLTMAGHMLDKVEVMKGQKVIDLELRGNRADCYSILGIAREVSALFKTSIKLPETDFKTKKVKGLPEATLTVKTPLVKRVMMVVIKDVKIEASPDWLTIRLKEYGLAPINNIVDLTNYVMIEIGEPMHAFDLDKVGKSLEIRLAKKGERMVTFQGTTLTLTDHDLVWANKDSILSVAGAIGGRNHSISSATKNVLLEAASYDRANIRRSIHNHNLFTDAGIRHEKELDPNIVESGMLRFLYLIEENGWGKVVPAISDYYPKPVKPWKVTLDLTYFKSLTGVTIKLSRVKEILTWLDFKILSTSSKKITVLVPTFRTDVVLPEDLAEEIVRILGYQEIPVQTLSLEIPKEVTPTYINQEMKIKSVFTSLGFDEIISSSFVTKDNLDNNKAFGEINYTPVLVQNEPSPDVEFLRTSLFANLITFSQKIFDQRGEAAQLFEVGKVYLKTKARYIEKRRLGIIYTSSNRTGFDSFKGYLEAFFEKINVKNPLFRQSDSLPAFLKKSFEIYVDGVSIGYGGQKDNFFYTEIDLDLLLPKEEQDRVSLWPKYPPQIEDITLSIPLKTKIGEVMEVLQSNKVVVDTRLVDIYKDLYTFRVWYQSPDKTLTNSEVGVVRKGFTKLLMDKFGAEVK